MHIQDENRNSRSFPRTSAELRRNLVRGITSTVKSVLTDSQQQVIRNLFFWDYAMSRPDDIHPPMFELPCIDVIRTIFILIAPVLNNTQTQLLALIILNKKTNDVRLATGVSCLDCFDLLKHIERKPRNELFEMRGTIKSVLTDAQHDAVDTMYFNSWDVNDFCQFCLSDAKIDKFPATTFTAKNCPCQLPNNLLKTIIRHENAQAKLYKVIDIYFSLPKNKLDLFVFELFDDRPNKNRTAAKVFAKAESTMSEHRANLAELVEQIVFNMNASI